MSPSDSHGPATRLIHTGERPPAAASLTVPSGIPLPFSAAARARALDRGLTVGSRAAP